MYSFYCTVHVYSRAGPNNTVFSIHLSITNPNNRTVKCNRLSQGPEKFLCEFCINLNSGQSDPTNCYNLNGSSADAVLTNLPGGTYLYRVIAYLNGVPIASIFDQFTTRKFHVLI